MSWPRNKFVYSNPATLFILFLATFYFNIWATFVFIANCGHFFWHLSDVCLPRKFWFFFYFDIWATLVFPANCGHFFWHLSDVCLPRKFWFFFLFWHLSDICLPRKFWFFFLDIWATFVCPTIFLFDIWATSDCTAIFFYQNEFQNLTFEIH